MFITQANITVTRLAGFKALPLSCVALIAALAAPANAAWVSTSTHDMSKHLTQAVQGGALPEQTNVRIMVGLKMRSADSLESYTHSILTPGNPAYGQKMTAAQFDAQYSPTSEQVDSVVSYLKASGFTNIQIPADRLYVTAEGTPSAIQRAFNTSMSTFTLDGRQVFANTADAQIPDSMSDTVLSVVGLNNIAPMHTHIKHSGAKPAVAAKSALSGTSASMIPDAGTPSPLMEYTSVAFQTVYDVGSVPAATNTTIAIFAEGDLTQVLLDLRQAEKENGLPQQPYEVRQIGAQSGDTTGADEFDLDTQSASGFAQEVKNLVIYDTTSLNDVDLIPSFNQFVIDNDSQAGSASFGGCELTEMTSGAIPTYDQIFHKAFVQGQTVFASSGDAGAACPEVASLGVPDVGVPTGQSFPCSSPYVTCVGGTTLTTDAEDNYILEISWDSGGGGTSEVEAPEFWQYNIVPTSSATVPPTPATGTIVLPLYKGVPDVAMDADNQLSPASIVVNGADEGVGGTSLASPLALGAWARFESSHCNNLGNASPLLYKFATAADATTGTLPSVVGFHDITVGTNGLYTALPGWDYTTGLGTFDITVVNGLLPNACANPPVTTTTGAGGTTATTTGSTTGGTTTGSTTTGSGVTTSSSSVVSGDNTGTGDSGAFGLPVLLSLFGFAAIRRRRA